MGTFSWRVWRFGWASGDWSEVPGWRQIVGRLWWCRS